MLPDRVFGPTTTTRHVYDVAAQHVVSGSMEGISGKNSLSIYSLFRAFTIFLIHLKCHHPWVLNDKAIIVIERRLGWNGTFRWVLGALFRWVDKLTVRIKIISSCCIKVKWTDTLSIAM